MKLGIKGIKLMVAGAIILLCGIAIHKVGASLHAVQQYMVHCDPLFSDGQRNALCETVAIQCRRADNTPQRMTELLLRNFPSIALIEIQYDTKHLGHVIIQASQPVLSINKQFVMTEHGAVVPAQVYCSNACDDLHDISVPNSTDGALCVSTFFAQTATKFSASLFDAYDITWVDDEKALLVDKEQPNFMIVFNTFSLPDTQRLQACNHIKQELLKSDAFEKKIKNQAQQWCADIRFKNQIILSCKVGGQQYG